MKSNKYILVVASLLIGLTAWGNDQLTASEWAPVVSKTIDWDEQGGQSLLFDIDGDGLLDMYYICNNGPRAYRNRGNGTFDQHPNIGYPMYDAYRFSNNYAFDYNCDGHVDIITVGRNHNGNLSFLAKLYVNDYLDQNTANDASGYGWFHEATLESLGIPNAGHWERNPDRTEGDPDCPLILRPVTIGDYNHDGYPDLLVVCHETIDGQKKRITRLYKNNAGNGFTEERIFDQWDGTIRQIEKNDIMFVDLNNDGWLDILINGYSDRGGYIYLNDQGKAFYEVANFVTPYNISRDTGFGVGDFNGDGWYDFVTMGYGDHIKDDNGGGWGARLFMNKKGEVAGNSDVIFADSYNIAGDLGVGDWHEDSRPIIRDFDGDGKLDIMKEYSQRITYYGTSDHTFTEGSHLYSRGQGTNRCLVSFGDVTGNGLTDVFVTDYQWCQATQGWKFVDEVYKNIKGGADKTMPALPAPSGVYYSIESDGIVVHWSDANNLRVGYNVIVETKDGKVFANLPVNTTNSKLMVGEGREVAVRPGVGAIGYKLFGISPSNIKRVGVQTLSVYNETVSPIVWAN